MTDTAAGPAQADHHDTAYKIGYGRPPMHTRFAKGHSGNPNGRPKRPDGIVIRKLFGRQHLAANGAKTTAREAFVRQILKGASEGNPGYFRKFMDLMQRSGLILRERPKHANIIRFDSGPSPSPETYEAWKRKKAAEQISKNNDVNKSREEAALRQVFEVPQRRRNKRKHRKLTQDDEITTTVFRRLATQRVKVTQNGRRQTVSLAEAILLKNFNAAISGDPVAINLVWTLAERGGEFEERDNPEKVGKPLILPHRFDDVEEFVAFYGVNTVKR